jgi:peptide/nickel transport system ATP-binding protein
MYAGRIVEQGRVDDVLDPRCIPIRRASSARSVPAEPAWARLAQIPGATPSLDLLPPGCAFAPRCGRVVEACRAAPPPESQREGRAALLQPGAAAP